MAYFAHVKNEIVDAVIVINESDIERANGWHCPTCGEHKPLSEWIQTSYNTCEGQHKQGGTPLRKNYAGQGYKYDKARDAFIPPKPYESWTLNEQKCVYEAPKPMPNERADWNEATKDWVKK